MNFYIICCLTFFCFNFRTSCLLDAHKDTLKEEGVIAKLLQRVEKLAVKGKEAIAKVTRLQADLEHRAPVQQGREMELKRLQGESKERRL